MESPMNMTPRPARARQKPSAEKGRREQLDGDLRGGGGASAHDTVKSGLGYEALDLIHGHGLLLTTGASCAAGCAPGLSIRASSWGR